MIDIELLRSEQTRQQTIDNLGKRNVAASAITSLIDADTAWREATEKLEAIRAKKKTSSSAIATASEGDKATIITAMQALGGEEKQLEESLAHAEETRTALWKQIPNIPLNRVQPGGEKDFKVVATSETPVPPREETPKDYITLMGNRIDMERGSKVSGARFTYLSGDLARLELAVASYVIDTLSGKGFVQVVPPLLIGEQAMAGMGYLDQAGDEVYKAQDGLYLIGTSEQSLGAMHMNEILPLEQLPLRYCALSPCFRREAGSHGKDVKGILRLHQFNKVEMFSITTPHRAENEHQFLLAQQRNIMDSLQLPYRVIMLAAGDLGSPSAITYDIETWIPSEGKYRETHSTSNTTDYQSRRLNIRYRNAEGNTEKVHMLNGTAVALSRLLIALIEHHQKPDGSVAIPEALRPYVPFRQLSPSH